MKLFIILSIALVIVSFISTIGARPVTETTVDNKSLEKGS
jgi:hypothetical protein